MPIQTKGKTQFIEAKQKQVPKPQFAMTQEELIKKVAAQSTTGATADMIGAGSSVAGRASPGQKLTTGQLKPEFQVVENIAQTSEAQGTFGQQGDVFSAPEKISKGFEIPNPILFIEKIASENAGQQVKGWPAITATVKGLIEGLGLNVRGLGIQLGTDPATKADKVMSAALDLYSSTGKEADAQELLNTLNDVEEYLTQEQGYSKLRADAKKLVDGKQTLDEYDIQKMKNKVNSNRLVAADLIRTMNLANIQAQTRRQTTAGAESQGGLAA